MSDAEPADSPPRDESPAAAVRPRPLPDVPGYEVLDVLGYGGMGVVYKARDARTKRLVALKMLRTGPHSRPEDLARFRIEAEAAARLLHPNIVQIFHVGEAAGLPYLALEFVDGGPLSKSLGAPMAPGRAAGLVETLARAIHSAHERGIVHRDLKPANILLTTDGAPKIGDFGLAKRIAEPGMTETNAVLGTLGYMAPEQAWGGSEVREIGPAADVYALGVILYEALVGRVPFEGESTGEVLGKIWSEEPVRPRAVRPEVPRDLDTITLKCLEKDPAKRYATALDLADDLRRFLADVPIRARAVGRLERLVRMCRRNPLPAALGAILGLVFVAGFVAVTLQLRRNVALRGEAEAARDRGEADLYRTRVAIADREWTARRLSAALHALDLCRPAAGRPDRRGFEWDWLRRRCHGELLAIEIPGADVNALAAGPDGTLVAVATSSPDVLIVDTATGALVRRLRGHESGVEAVAWAAGGRSIVSAGRDYGVRLWDPTTGECVRTISDHRAIVKSVGISADGSRIVSQGGDVLVHDAGTGRLLHRVGSDGTYNFVGSAALSPDGKRVMIAASRILIAPEADHVLLVDLEDGVKTVARARVPSGGRVAWNPDGSRIGFAGDDGDVRVWPGDLSGVPVVLRGHSSAVEALSFSGRDRLATASLDRTVRVWDLAPEAATEAVVLHAHDQFAEAVAFLPDGRVVTGSHAGGLWYGGRTDGRGELKVWNPSHPQGGLVLKGSRVALSRDGSRFAFVRGKIVEVRDLDGERAPVPFETGEVVATALSPDGGRVACSGADGTVVVRDVAASSAPRTIPDHRCGPGTLAWSPDGSRIAFAEKDAVLVFDAATLRPERTLRGLGRDVTRVGFGPLRDEVVGLAEDRASGADAIAWNLVTGAWRRLVPEARAEGAPLLSIAVSPDGRRLALHSGAERIRHRVEIRDLAHGGDAIVLRDFAGEVMRVLFSADGRRLLCAGGDPMGREGGDDLRLFDPETGDEVLSLRGHQRPVYDAVWSQDGHVLASEGSDGMLRIWDGRPGEWPVLTIAP